MTQRCFQPLDLGLKLFNAPQLSVVDHVVDQVLGACSFIKIDEYFSVRRLDAPVTIDGSQLLAISLN